MKQATGLLIVLAAPSLHKSDPVHQHGVQQLNPISPITKGGAHIVPPPAVFRVLSL